MSWCTQITPNAMEYLVGIKSLMMTECNPATIRRARELGLPIWPP
jgi:hypothetical protein